MEFRIGQLVKLPRAVSNYCEGIIVGKELIKKEAYRANSNWSANTKQTGYVYLVQEYDEFLNSYVGSSFACSQAELEKWDNGTCKC